MRIVCPFIQRIPSQKAHDKLIVRTCAALARQGAEVILLGPAPLPSVEDLIRRYALPAGVRLAIASVPGRRFLFRRRLIRRAEPLGAEAIYVSEMSVAAVFAEERARFGGARLYYEAHTLHGDPREGRLFRDVSGVLATTGALAARIKSRHPAIARLTVVPLASGWASDLEIRPPLPEGTSERVRLGYAGQLYPLQGVDVLLESLALLPEADLTVAGGRPLEHELLLAASRRLGISERVTLLGHLEPVEVARHLQNMDVLLLPSRAGDRMPFVAHTKAFEYMAARRAIVASDLPSLREELGGCALFVSPEDPVSWAASIRKLAEDRGLKERLADEAFARARAFTWERRAEAMLMAMAS